MSEKENILPKDTFMVGNKLFGKCAACGRIVRIDKPILGSVHLCIPQQMIWEEEDEN